MAPPERITFTGNEIIEIAFGVGQDGERLATELRLAGVELVEGARISRNEAGHIEIVGLSAEVVN